MAMGDGTVTAATTAAAPHATKKTSRGGRKRRDQASHSYSVSSLVPSEIVCTAHDVATSKNSTELAVLLSALVIGLYLFGFLESMQFLPDIPDGRRVGTNLNMARLEAGTTTGESRPGLTEVGRQMQQQEAGGKDPAGGGDGGGGFPVPPGKWPVTLRDELDDFETIIHGGDGTTEMQVPRFWSPPLHRGRPFPREEAMRVGTCEEPDPVTGSRVRGDACPADMRTIFVAIASYRDFQCRYTLESVFLRATNPDRIRVGA